MSRAGFDRGLSRVHCPESRDQGQPVSLRPVLKGEDVVLMLKLLQGVPDWTVRALADAVRIPRSGVHRSLGRLREAGLLDGSRMNVSRSEEFLVHAVKYMFPPAVSGEARGVPTAWSALPLSDAISSGPSELPIVWPHPLGQVRGLALAPLHPAVPGLALDDSEMWARLALVDGLRMGDARVRGVAEKLLVAKLDVVTA
jgi:hypothetical protein